MSQFKTIPTSMRDPLRELLRVRQEIQSANSAIATAKTALNSSMEKLKDVKGDLLVCVGDNIPLKRFVLDGLLITISATAKDVFVDPIEGGE